MPKTDWDVIIVGAGPGGSSVAKRCAQHGLKTLLLEKRQLPRDKVCSGMLMSFMTQNIVRQAFGEIPEDILTTPPYLSGIMLHVPGLKDAKVNHKMPLAWRKDLDYWMSQKAQEVGVEVWDGASVTELVTDIDGYTVKLKTAKETKEIKGRFIIGADGAASIVRRALFPNLKVAYSQNYRECYHGQLGIDKEYFHYFFYSPNDPNSFGIHHKEGVFLIELGTRMGQLKQRIHQAKEILLKEPGFKPENQPLRRDGCLSPVSLYRELFSGAFLPARENALLVGDAAGLAMPLTLEGIGTAIKSGLLAADSIIQANKRNEKAAKFYLAEMAGVTSTLKGLYPLYAKIREQASKGGEYLLDAFKEAVKASLQIA